MSRLNLAQTVGRWLDASGPDSDVVFSSRVRLARNLTDFPFAARLKPADQQEIIDCLADALKALPGFQPGTLIDAARLSLLESSALVERHLISPDFVSSPRPRALYVSPDQSLSLMVNEEDHLRFSALAAGLAFDAARFELDEMERLLEGQVTFAFSDELGFLTACPTNVGTGMRASILVHLPGLALTRELDRVLRGIVQIGLSVRGLYGEGTETKGHLFQISNQVTLGVTEDEIAENLTKIARQIIGFEKQARDFLLANLRAEIEDKVFRALALMRCARLMTSEEVINLTSAVRLGIALGLLPDVKLTTVNEIFILTQPANLQLWLGKEMSASERDRARAEFVRRRLGSS